MSMLRRLFLPALIASTLVGCGSGDNPPAGSISLPPRDQAPEAPGVGTESTAAEPAEGEEISTEGGGRVGLE